MLRILSLIILSISVHLLLILIISKEIPSKKLPPIHSTHLKLALVQTTQKEMIKQLVIPKKKPQKIVKKRVKRKKSKTKYVVKKRVKRVIQKSVIQKKTVVETPPGFLFDKEGEKETVKIVKKVKTVKKEIVAIKSPVKTVKVDTQEIKKAYLKTIRKEIMVAQVYPKMARRRRQQGIIFIEFRLLKSGEIDGLLVVKPSRYRLLNRAALATLTRAAPFKPIPDILNLEVLSIQLPIRFQLK